MRGRRLLLATELVSPPTPTNTTSGGAKQSEKLLSPPLPPPDVNGNLSANPFNQAPPTFNSSMVVTVLVLLTALFFMGFFSVYVRRFAEDSPSGDITFHRRGRTARQSARTSSGLDQETVLALPTFPYKCVSDDDSSLCAVCLGEFEAGETAKLLPFCGHFFHVECIDAWLASHTSCPLCRATLLSRPPQAKEEVAPPREEEPPPQRDDPGDSIVLVVRFPADREAESGLRRCGSGCSTSHSSGSEGGQP